jgi:NitT/TauT family transport system substrate-binding protein
MDTLTISATGNGLNYLPEYVAQHFGLFAERGLTVRSWACDPWTGVLDDLSSGRADFALGGLWVPAIYAHMGRPYSAAVQLNARMPMALLARSPLSTFEWADLANKTVLVPGAGGLAGYEYSAGLMREAGVDPAGTTFIRDLSTAMMTEMFANGIGDVLIADLLTVKDLVLKGAGFLVCNLIERGGPMPNSVYYHLSSRASELDDRIRRFAEATDHAMRLLQDLDESALAPVFSARWPTADPRTLDDSWVTMRDGGTWSGTTIEPDAASHWLTILQDGGVVHRSTVISDYLA